jgi:hypothetical protein
MRMGSLIISLLAQYRQPFQIDTAPGSRSPGSDQIASLEQHNHSIELLRVFGRRGIRKKRREQKSFGSTIEALDIDGDSPVDRHEVLDSDDDPGNGYGIRYARTRGIVTGTGIGSEEKQRSSQHCDIP